MNTSVANTARWREWRAKNPANKNKYPNVASFLKDFPTKAANYQAAANASAAAPKKRSFKNRVKGFFSKVGSRFTKKKNEKQTNKNYVTSAKVGELNAQTQQLKNLLQRQIENAGQLNMDNETKRIVQQNIETTRSLIEARQREMTDREEKAKLEALKKNVVSVGNVVQNAPTSGSSSSMNSATRRNLTRKAMNALNRMSGMNGVAAQISELQGLLKKCCEEGGMSQRNRSGSVSSVGTNNRAAENEENANAAAKFAFNNEGWNEARNLAGRTVGNAAAPASATKEQPNFFEKKPKMRPNFFERPGVMPKRSEEPSPAELYGSNNFENEPLPSSKENTSVRGRLLKGLGLNASATEKDIERAFRKASLNAHRAGSRNSNTYKVLSGLYSNWKNQLNPYEHNEPNEPNEPAKENVPNAVSEPAEEENWQKKLNALKAKGKNATDEEWQTIRPTTLNNYHKWDMDYAVWKTSKESDIRKEQARLLPRLIEGAKKRLVEYRGYLKNAKNTNEYNEILDAIAKEEKYLKNQGVNVNALNGTNNVSPAGLFGNNTFEAEPNVKKNNNNVSPAGLFGNNTFEAEPNTPPSKDLSMNTLTNNEKNRVRLMKELNDSITNNNALNMIRQEREQKNRNLVSNYQKKRSTSRSKRGKTYKGGKRRNVTRRR